MDTRSSLAFTLIFPALTSGAMAQFPSPVVLPSNTGIESVALTGSSGSGQLGLRQTPIGDFNGDGREDFAVAAHNWTIPGGNSSTNRGAVHVLFGSNAWSSLTSANMLTLDGTLGFTVFGANNGDMLGYRIAGAGDVNGDGYDDLAMVAHGFDVNGESDRGGVYVLYGGPQVGAGGSVLAASIGGTSGFVAYAPPKTTGLVEVCGLGDVDGDGFDELAVASPGGGPAEWIHLLGAEESRCLAAGDIDGDGDDDFVLGQLQPQRALVFVNDNGQFTPMPVPLGCWPQAIELADMDGDGDLDIVVHGNGRRVAILPCLLGTIFGNPRNFDLPDDQSIVRLGDIDADGDLDVVAANYTDTLTFGGIELVHILRNNGNGFLTEIGTVNFDDEPRSLAVGDIDGDGDADFLMNGHYSSAIRAYENLGNGTFAAPVIGPIVTAYDMSLADVDGDGDLDALCGAGGYLYLALNQGAFSFGAPTSLGSCNDTERILPADVDMDGDMDIVTCGRDPSNAFRCFLNNGDGTFPLHGRHFPQPMYSAYDIALADVDGSGNLGVIVVGKVVNQADYRVVAARGFGDGTFGGERKGCVAVVRGAPDLSAHAPYDLGETPSPYHFVMLGRNGREELGTALSALGDLDTDGFADFAVTAQSAYVPGGSSVAHFVIRGGAGVGATGFIDPRALTGSNGFVLHSPPQATTLTAAALGSGDFDGDGQLDLIASARTTVALNTFVGAAIVSFGSPTLGATGVELADQPDGLRLLRIVGSATNDGTGEASPAVGDFNGDGRADIVLGAPRFIDVLSSGGAALGIYGAQRPFPGGVLSLGSMDGTTSFRMLREPGNTWMASNVSTAGDVDGDGIDDLLISDDRYGSSSGRAILVLGQRYGAPSPYCTAQVNSAGCTPAIGWSGALPSVSDPDSFHVRATNVLNQKGGLLFYGRFGRTAAPLQGGTLCARQPVLRTPTQSSGGSASGIDCSGTYDFDWKAWMTLGVDPSLAAGVTIDCQYWSRDPQAPFGTNLTDALEFTIAP